MSRTFALTFLSLIAVYFSVPGALAQKSISSNECKLTSGKIVIPNILGLDVQNAKKVVESCDLVWSYSSSPKTFSYEAIGTIGAQEPKGGLVVKPGSTVRGFLSKGFYSPQYIGWQVSQAVNHAKDLRLGVSVKTVWSEAPVGTVIDQNHKNGVFYNSGLALVLTVSEGPWVHVPDVVNKRYSTAKRDLANVGLVPVHAGGSLDSGQKQQTICELRVWYPVVERREPTDPKLFKGDTVMLYTKTRTDLVTVTPPNGQLCP